VNPNPLTTNPQSPSSQVPEISPLRNMAISVLNVIVYNKFSKMLGWVRRRGKGEEVEVGNFSFVFGGAGRLLILRNCLKIYFTK
jgi:hypothetical protein